jgi:hypothetical protein
MRDLNQTVAVEMPYGICDVTIPIRFSLDDEGLRIESMKTKENLMGFYNPIPPFKEEHNHPVLCIIYTRPNIDPETYHIEYYNDTE